MLPAGKWCLEDLHRAGGIPAVLSVLAGRIEESPTVSGRGILEIAFVMLRDRIGAAAFAQGIREFWAMQQFKVASWRDLQLAFERLEQRAEQSVDRSAVTFGCRETRLDLPTAHHLFDGAAVTLDVNLDLVEQSW